MNIFRIIGTLGLLISFVKLIFSFSPFWPLSFPLSLSLSLKVICNGFLKLFTQDVNRLLCFFGPVWEIHDHPLGRGGFWHSDLPSFLSIVCCAGSEWTQFIIRSIHQAYSVGTNCQCNHQRREREVLDLLPFWILPSRLPNRIFPVVHSSISCVYTVWTICWFLLSHLSRKLQVSPQCELPTVYKN